MIQMYINIFNKAIGHLSYINKLLLITLPLKGFYQQSDIVFDIF